jgi:hypothetical protein
MGTRWAQILSKSKQQKIVVSGKSGLKLPEAR